MSADFPTNDDPIEVFTLAAPGAKMRTVNLRVTYRIRIPADAPLVRCGIDKSISLPPMHLMTGRPSPESGQGTMKVVPLQADFLTYQEAWAEGDGWPSEPSDAHDHCRHHDGTCSDIARANEELGEALERARGVAVALEQELAEVHDHRRSLIKAMTLILTDPEDQEPAEPEADRIARDALARVGVVDGATGEPIGEAAGGPT